MAFSKPQGVRAVFSNNMSETRESILASAVDAMLDTIDRIRLGGLVVDAYSSILAINMTAKRLLGPRLESVATINANARLKWSKKRRGGEVAQLGSIATTTLETDDESSYVCHRTPLKGAKGCSLILLISLEDVPAPNPAMLRTLFGLTEAEANLAGKIVQYSIPPDIARDQNVSVTTIRSQLASVFAKTNTRRQSELAVLLSRVAMLP